jgi:hypothetical protein
VQISLSDGEVQTSRKLSDDHLPDLKGKSRAQSRTSSCHLLVTRQELCERLLRELQLAGSSGVQLSASSPWSADKEVL